jgi:hypothetical protein
MATMEQLEAIAVRVLPDADSSVLCADKPLILAGRVTSELLSELPDFKRQKVYSVDEMRNR